MNRSNFNLDIKKEIESVSKKISDETLVEFVIGSSHVIGDILDIENHVDRPDVYIKLNEVYDFFSDEEGTINYKSLQTINEVFKENKNVNFKLGLDECSVAYPVSETINDFISKNNIIYKDLALKESAPNIFNNPECKNAFYNLAQSQRYRPEKKMLETQKIIGGGLMNSLIEHVGDLTHRMSQRIYIERGDLHYSISDIRSKLDNGIYNLRKGDDFEVEVERNRRSNFEYNFENKDKYPFEYTSYESYDRSCRNSLTEYAKEHAKLGVFNESQHFAKYAAVHLGNGDYEKSLDCLKQLKDSIDDNTYSLKASRYDENYEYNSLDLVMNKINSNFKNEISKLKVREKEDKLEVSDIVIEKIHRCDGVGKEIFKELKKYAKQNNKVIHLIPNGRDLSYGTTSLGRLEKFYKKQGFEKTKDSDFSSGTMIIDYRKETLKEKLNQRGSRLR